MFARSAIIRVGKDLTKCMQDLKSSGDLAGNKHTGINSVTNMPT